MKNIKTVTATLFPSFCMYVLVGWLVGCLVCFAMDRWVHIGLIYPFFLPTKNQHLGKGQKHRYGIFTYIWLLFILPVGMIYHTWMVWDMIYSFGSGGSRNMFFLQGKALHSGSGNCCSWTSGWIRFWIRFWVFFFNWTNGFFVATSRFLGPVREKPISI